MTLLQKYWPTRAEVFNCIKREAETASEAVLLAVHQPMPLTARNAGSQQETPVTEHDFLEAFLTSDLPEGTLIQAVTGPSGAGKSHLVRWLAAQLERDPRAKERMHVVRIPKTASLRMVVERILEPLEGEPQFADARAEVHKVVAEVTPRNGAIRLAAGLKIALNELSDRIASQLQSDPRAPNARELKTKLYHAQELPHYFNDPALEKHFTDNVLARIVSRSVSGQRDPDADAPLPQFEPVDLMPPGGVHFGDSSVQVRRYYQTGLNVNGGEGFARAVDVLNDKVLDQAIGEVFRLGQALGGVTLSDLIMHIRTLLFRQGRELVLLIEDFAALSGIQEALLSVCIQEAVYDGKQIRAPMRTVLAVTDGYLQSRDTILTRARREWLVKTELNDDDDALAHTTALVGGYLNAARWGEAELTRHFKERARTSSVTGWVPAFRDEALTDAGATLLGAFGRSSEIPLFPYNQALISSLARRHLSEGGKLKFQPRTIINLILKNILERRDDYERGAFPPPNFEGARPTADVAAWLDRSVPSMETRGRLASLLAHWGGNPVDIDDIADTPVGLFEAFSLPTPKLLGLAVHTARPGDRPTRPGRTQRPTGPQPQPGPTPGPQEPENPDLVRWRQRLEEWTGGELLQQRDANLLRRTIEGLLMKAVDWNALRIARSAAPPVFISIPNAGGQDASISARTVRLEIAETHEDSDGRLRRSLLAIVSYRLHGSTWKYNGADEDSAVAATFMERLTATYAAQVEKKVMEEIAGLSDLLLRQARVMGIAGRASNQPDSVASVALSVAPAIASTNLVDGSYEQKWHQLREEVCANRHTLQGLLTERMACFQGNTRTIIHAIDTVRLREALKVSQKTLPKEADVNPLLNHAQNLDERRLRARALPVAQNLAQFADYVRGTIGSSFSKDDYLHEAKDLVTVVEDANVWPPGNDKRGISRVIEDFRQTPVQDALDRIERVPPQELETASVDALLALVSQVDLSVVARTRASLKTIGDFLDAVDQEATRLEQTAQSADPEPKASAIDASLVAIDTDLRSLIAR
jgi:hypothetical protein